MAANVRRQLELAIAANDQPRIAQLVAAADALHLDPFDPVLTAARFLAFAAPTKQRMATQAANRDAQEPPKAADARDKLAAPWQQGATSSAASAVTAASSGVPPQSSTANAKPGQRKFGGSALIAGYAAAEAGLPAHSRVLGSESFDGARSGSVTGHRYPSRLTEAALAAAATGRVGGRDVFGSHRHPWAAEFEDAATTDDTVSRVSAPSTAVSSVVLATRPPRTPDARAPTAAAARPDYVAAASPKAPSSVIYPSRHTASPQPSAAVGSQWRPGARLTAAADRALLNSDPSVISLVVGEDAGRRRLVLAETRELEHELRRFADAIAECQRRELRTAMMLLEDTECLARQDTFERAVRVVTQLHRDFTVRTVFAKAQDRVRGEELASRVMLEGIEAQLRRELMRGAGRRLACSVADWRRDRALAALRAQSHELECVAARVGAGHAGEVPLMTSQPPSPHRPPASTAFPGTP